MYFVLSRLVIIIHILEMQFVTGGLIKLVLLYSLISYVMAALNAGSQDIYGKTSKTAVI